MRPARPAPLRTARRPAEVAQNHDAVRTVLTRSIPLRVNGSASPRSTASSCLAAARSSISMRAGSSRTICRYFGPTDTICYPDVHVQTVAARQGRTRRNGNRSDSIQLAVVGSADAEHVARLVWRDDHPVLGDANRSVLLVRH